MLQVLRLSTVSKYAYTFITCGWSRLMSAVIAIYCIFDRKSVCRPLRPLEYVCALVRMTIMRVNDAYVATCLIFNWFSRVSSWLFDSWAEEQLPFADDTMYGSGKSKAHEHRGV